MKPVVVAILVLAQGNAAEWKAFEPKGLGFHVSVPGDPEATEQTIKSLQGPIEVRTFTVPSAEGTYVVGVTEHPESAVPAGRDQARLDQAREGAVKSVKGRLRSQSLKNLVIDGKPAREFFIATETGHAIKVRLIADRNRLYQLMVVGNTRFLDSPEATRFLESFRFAK